MDHVDEIGKKRSWQVIYNIAVVILCIVSVYFAILDIHRGLTAQQIWIDRTIYMVFVVDYIIRFGLADKKTRFVKENIFDLIAILPFNSALRAFRVLRFTKFLRFAKFTKLIRVGSVSARMLSKVKVFFDTNGFKYTLALAVSCMLIATFGIMYFEHMNFGDALWWSFVTVTTVGYGDLSPASIGGRIIASVLMVVGIGLIGSLVSTITSFFLHPHLPNAKQRQEPEVNLDKVKMVLTMYESLSDTEKEVLRQKL
jgi:voltage-gated potassium channel